jgi:hypothetical protein
MAHIDEHELKALLVKQFEENLCINRYNGFYGVCFDILDSENDIIEIYVFEVEDGRIELRDEGESIDRLGILRGYDYVEGNPDILDQAERIAIRKSCLF